MMTPTPSIKGKTDSEVSLSGFAKAEEAPTHQTEILVIAYIAVLADYSTGFVKPTELESPVRYQESSVVAVDSKSAGWKEVHGALMDSKWKWRSVNGISRSTGIPTFLVESILEENKNKIRLSPVLTPNGEVLYTSRERRFGWRDRLWYFLVYLTRAHR